MKKGNWFYLIVALQVVFLIGMIGFKQSTIWFGTKVLLKPMPYDPTDFFRGDYINIRYEISTIKPESVGYKGGDFKRGDKIFVKLQKGKEYWNATQISMGKLQGEYIKGTVENIYSKNSFTIKETNSSKTYVYEETIYEFAPSGRESFDVGDKVQFSESNGRVNYLMLCQGGACPYQSDKYMDYKTGNIINVRKGVKEISIKYPIETYFVPKNEGNLPQFRTADMLVEAALWNGDAIATNLLIDGQKIDFR